MKKVMAKVKALYKYKTFDDLFSAFPAEYFGGTSKEALVEEIRKFYSTEDEQKNGVVGIKIYFE